MENQTNHYKNKRHKREKFIEKYLYGDGKIIDSFVVDRCHKNGLEKHCVTDTGLIIVYNLESGKLVTKLVARPAQIKRYYINSGREPPSYLIRLAQWHENLGYNK